MCAFLPLVFVFTSLQLLIVVSLAVIDQGLEAIEFQLGVAHKVSLDLLDGVVHLLVFPHYF